MLNQLIQPPFPAVPRTRDQPVRHVFNTMPLHEYIPRKARLMDIKLQQTLLSAKAAAGDLASLAVHEDEANRQGFIEMAAVDASGNVWIVGWMNQDKTEAFPAVLVDRQKYPSSMCVIAEFTREDLPQGASGIIAVLTTDWRPSSESEAILYFGSKLLSHLRALRPLPVVKMTTVFELFDQVKGRSRSAFSEVANQLLMPHSEWMPTELSALGFPLSLDIDSVLVVPGFGCLTRGWILSPAKQIVSMRVKTGSSVLKCDESRLVFEGRPDLKAVNRHVSTDFSKAGFVSLFLGNVSSDAVHDLRLQIDFAGGITVTREISPLKVSLLGISAPVDSISRFYPSIQHEEIFASLAKSVRLFEKQRHSSLFEYKVSGKRKAIVVALPPDRSDALLVFESLTELAGDLPDDVGITVIASRSHDRGHIVSRFTNLGRSRATGLSLFFVDDPAYALFVLDKILPALSADVFSFVGAGVYLSRSGWKQLVENLSEDSRALAFFRVSNTRAQGGVQLERARSSCFKWNTVDFCRHAQTMSGYVGGHHQDNGMIKSSQLDPATTSVSGSYFRPHLQSSLALAINSAGA